MLEEMHRRYRMSMPTFAQVVAAVLHLLNVEFDPVDIPGQDIGSKVRYYICRFYFNECPLFCTSLD